jgi:WD40 repeat protein/tetratricopeptide (TPR) repeat protein
MKKSIKTIFFIIFILLLNPAFGDSNSFESSNLAIQGIPGDRSLYVDYTSMAEIEAAKQVLRNLDKKIRKELFLEKKDISEIEQGLEKFTQHIDFSELEDLLYEGKEDFLKHIKEVQVWQNLDFIKALRVEIEKKIPYELKVIIIKYLESKRNKKVKELVERKNKEVLEDQDCIDIYNVIVTSDIPELFDYRTVLDVEAPFSVVYVKLSKDIEKFKIKLIDIVIDILEGRITEDNLLSHSSLMNIHPEKSGQQGDLVSIIKEDLLRLIFQQFKSYIDEERQTEKKKVLDNLKQLKELRRKLLITSDRFNRVHVFLSFYEKYNKAYKEYLAEISNQEKKKTFFRYVFMAAALNEMPFRKRYALVGEDRKLCLYDDDDSMSAYSTYEALEIALEQGLIKQRSNMFEPFFGSGTTACIGQFLEFGDFTATELLLDPSYESEQKWVIALEENMKRFNASIIDKIKDLLGISDEEEINSFFKEIIYEQADVLKVREKEEFKVYRQKVSDSAEVRQYKTLPESYKFILANPPWGIATTVECPDEVNAFRFYFTDVMPVLYRLLETKDSACISRIPDYWIYIIQHIDEIRTFKDFERMFITMMLDEQKFFDKLWGDRKRVKTCDELLDEEGHIKGASKDQLEFCFFTLKFFFNNKYSLFSKEKVARNSLMLRKVKEEDSLEFLPALYMFYVEKCFKEPKFKEIKYNLDLLEEAFTDFRERYRDLLVSPLFAKYFSRLLDLKVSFIDFDKALPSVYQNWNEFVELLYRTEQCAKKIEIQGTELIFRYEDIIRQTEQGYNLTLYGFLLVFIDNLNPEVEITIKADEAQQNIINRMYSAWGIDLAGIFEFTEIDIDMEQGFNLDEIVMLELNLMYLSIVDNVSISIDEEFDLGFYISRVLEYKNSGNRENAITAFEELIKHNPYDVEAYYHLASIYIEQGEYEKVIANAEKVFSYAGFFCNFELIVRMHQYLVMVYLHVCDYEKAKIHLEKIFSLGIECLEKPSEFYKYKALLCEKQGNIEQAKFAIEEALKLLPDDVECLAHKQRLLGNYEQAREYFSQLFREFSQNMEFSYWVGFCYEKENNLVEAKKQYNKILGVNLNHIPSLISGGNILFKEKNYRDALVDYLKAIDMGCVSEEIINNLISITEQSPVTDNTIGAYVLLGKICNNKLSIIDKKKIINRLMEMYQEQRNFVLLRVLQDINLLKKSIRDLHFKDQDVAGVIKIIIEHIVSRCSRQGSETWCDILFEKFKVIESPDDLVVEEFKERHLQYIERKILGAGEKLALYEPLMASRDIKCKDSEPLEDMVMDFFESDKTSLLVLGDSGSGKTLFSLYLTEKLLKNYWEEGYLPIYISLASVGSDPNFIENELKKLGCDEELIEKLKNNRKVLFIFDGYDESQFQTNLYYTNCLEQWSKAKLISTCRTQFLSGESQMRTRFATPERTGNRVLNDVYIQLFTEQQIDSYLKRYVRTEEAKWKDWELYKRAIEKIRGIEDLIRTPFLLKILVFVLPDWEESKYLGRNITMADVYQEFMRQWFIREEVNLHRRAVFDVFEDITQESFEDFSEDLAFEMFCAGVTEVRYKSYASVRRRKNKWDTFFAPQGTQEMLAIIRRGCPLKRDDEALYSFIHKSCQEYFIAKKLFEEAISEDEEITKDSAINKKLIVKESAIIDFMVDMLSKDREKYCQKLLDIVLKTREDREIGIAGANAITILNAARFCFSGLDLSETKVSGANLTEAIMDGTILRKADLTNVILERVFFSKDTDLEDCIMTGVRFGELANLKSPIEFMESIAYSPDGRIIAVGGLQKTVYFLDAKTGEIKRKLEVGENENVYSIVFSPDGRTIAIELCDSVKIFSVSTGRLMKKLKGYQDYSYNVAYSPDGKTIATGEQDDVIRLLDINTWELKKELPCKLGSFLLYSPDGETIVTNRGSCDEIISLWDIRTGKLKHEWEGDVFRVSYVTYSPNGEILAGATSHNSIKLWDAKTGELKREIEVFTELICSIEFSSDGKKIATGGDDSSVRLWNVETGEFIKELKSCNDFIKSITYHPDGKIMATASHSEIRLWDITNINGMQRLKGHAGRVTSVGYSPDGRIIVTGSDDKIVRLWCVETGNLKKELKGHSGWVTSVGYSPDGRTIVTGSYDNTTRLWCAETGELKREIRGHDDIVASVAYNPTGEIIATGSWDSSVRLWNVETGEFIKELKGYAGWGDRLKYFFCGYYLKRTSYKGAVSSVVYSPDGETMATGGNDYTFKLWLAETGEFIKEFKGYLRSGYSGSIEDISYSPDGGTIAIIGSVNAIVWLLDSHTGELKKELEIKDSDSFSSVAYSPDGRTIATGSDDAILRLLDSHTGELKREIKGHKDAISSVAYSPDGKTIATGSVDHSLKIWQIEEEEDNITVRLLFTTNPQFFCEDVDITKVRGLRDKDRMLLKQRGAIDRRSYSLRRSA